MILLKLTQNLLKYVQPFKFVVHFHTQCLLYALILSLFLPLFLLYIL